MKFETFRKSVQLSKEDISRELLAENRDRIKIKKEKVAVRNLVKIMDAALAISNVKGFASMSLRDLSSEAGLSMGALYSYISSKEELLDMIQQQGRSV
ncbi:MAG TPA: helix-turn-helix domain-containing protein, partial [Deltaproteobacteria bacterium]|nr:helix-turn-helix domain-containing protein [Deltaproteobacteria bacterium]